MLRGLRLLDLSSRLPGPLCSLILSDLGMEVTRVEPPARLNKGDLFREIPGKDTPYFPMLNRGKKSVTLNLKTAKGKELFYELVEQADVVLEGFRPGVMDRLGIGWKRLREVNPQLILASISGYGQEGAYRLVAGHDLNYLAYAGILGLNASLEGGAPVRPPVQIADVAGGAYPAAIGILAALLARNRTGKGRWLDVSMLDGSLFLMGLAFFDWGIGKEVKRGIPPIARCAVNYHVYETKDGKYLALGALEENFWRGFCETIGHPEWISRYEDEVAMCDPDFLDEIRRLFLSRTRDEWMEIFAERDVCLSPVLSLDEVMTDRFVRSRGVITWRFLPDGKKIPQIRFPIRASNTDTQASEAPGLGQHTRRVFMDELKLSSSEIETLEREGVI